jgi:hypothetical protein
MRLGMLACLHTRSHVWSAKVVQSEKDSPIKTQDFSENENQDHADEDPRLAHERTHPL